tara:strand:+ start:1196 stop:2095 length:900 start_codon:yes stop_codon:yes gene_type:complete
MSTINKKPVANFFWNSDLSIYEVACLKSFLKNDFKVNVYSFKKIKLPNGAVLKHAGTVLKETEINKTIHGGKRGCLAAYADKFRIILQKKKLGWWFDMDVICLKNSKYFTNLNKNKKITVGYEGKDSPGKTKFFNSDWVNNAVLKIDNENFIDEVLSQIKKKGSKFKWGEIGPDLINTLLIKNKITSEIVDKKYFYAINFMNFDHLLRPEKYATTNKMCNSSYVIHNYNQVMNRFGIPKNILPPKGSYLYNKILFYCPEFKNSESLPNHTLLRLINKKNGFSENLIDLIPSLFRSLKLR